VIVLLASMGFAFWGVAPPADPVIRPIGVDARGTVVSARQPIERPTDLEQLPGAIQFSAQAATTLLRGPDRPLTELGEWPHMALRLVAPVLLGWPCCRSAAGSNAEIQHLAVLETSQQGHWEPP
jgi:hypothetical protein